MRQSLREKKAESDFSIAEFYRKQRHYEAASVYYKDIVENFPETTWAKKAQDRLKEMEKK